ncbi:MAG: hypothetical protein ACREXP_14185 [Steroidobacteraceae bacterium]
MSGNPFAAADPTAKIVFNSDKMVGGEFAKGLASLKSLVAGERAAAA